MGKIIFNFIRKFECVIKYQGESKKWEDDNAWDARSHINWAIVHAVWTSLLGFIHPGFLGLYPILFLLHSPLTELVFQYDKEKGQLLWRIMAQIIERGAAFGFLLPLPIAVLIITVTTNFYLLG